MVQWRASITGLVTTSDNFAHQLAFTVADQGHLSRAHMEITQRCAFTGLLAQPDLSFSGIQRQLFHSCTTGRAMF